MVLRDSSRFCRRFGNLRSSSRAVTVFGVLACEGCNLHLDSDGSSRGDCCYTGEQIRRYRRWHPRSQQICSAADDAKTVNTIPVGLISKSPVWRRVCKSPLLILMLARNEGCVAFALSVGFCGVFRGGKKRPGNYSWWWLHDNT